MPDGKLKKILVPNYYELLDVGITADEDEIRRAYNVAKQLYSSDSLAAYGLYSESELQKLSEQIEEAFVVLITPEKRKEYNAGLLSGPDKKKTRTKVRLHSSTSDKSAYASPRKMNEDEQDGEDDEMEESADPPAMKERAPIVTESGQDTPEIPEELKFSGAELRSLREQMGVELADIAKVTKISPGTIKLLESENWALLPAPVYVRGFLTAYAKYLRLDPKRVAADMMERIQEYKLDKELG